MPTKLLGAFVTTDFLATIAALDHALLAPIRWTLQARTK